MRPLRAARVGCRSAAAYAASKFGLRGWSLSIYEQLRHKNIKVLLINPAFVNTDMARSVTNRPDVLYERMLRPDDVAACVLLAVRTSSACVPLEVTLRLTRSAYKDA